MYYKFYDLTLFTNILNQAESQLHNLKQTARGIGLNVNSDKIVFMFYQDGPISSLKSNPLKLVNQFILLGSNISSTESDVNIHVEKVCTSIDRLSTKWKSDPSDKMKLFQCVTLLVLLYDCTTWIRTKRLKKKLDGKYTRMLHVVLNKSWKQQMYDHLFPISQTIQVRL